MVVEHRLNGAPWRYRPATSSSPAFGRNALIPESWQDTMLIMTANTSCFRCQQNAGMHLREADDIGLKFQMVQPKERCTAKDRALPTSDVFGVENSPLLQFGSIVFEQCDHCCPYQLHADVCSYHKRRCSVGRRHIQCQAGVSRAGTKITANDARSAFSGGLSMHADTPPANVVCSWQQADVWPTRSLSLQPFQCVPTRRRRLYSNPHHAAPPHRRNGRPRTLLLHCPRPRRSVQRLRRR